MHVVVCRLLLVGWHAFVGFFAHILLDCFLSGPRSKSVVANGIMGDNPGDAWRSPCRLVFVPATLLSCIRLRNLRLVVVIIVVVIVVMIFIRYGLCEFLTVDFQGETGAAWRYVEFKCSWQARFIAF